MDKLSELLKEYQNVQIELQTTPVFDNYKGLFSTDKLMEKVSSEVKKNLTEIKNEKDLNEYLLTLKNKNSPDYIIPRIIQNTPNLMKNPFIITGLYIRNTSSS